MDIGHIGKPIETKHNINMPRHYLLVKLLDKLDDIPERLNCETLDLVTGNNSGAILLYV